ncbi:hypothetical protein [Paenibacillus cremeus]|uniref:Uncharacterized protein n=1 Tax=Paenibacillus cremeus TaxID=2163881 RepID=A0A559K409_9BACL|nr:hypothetical protein [Paenibacillus cremeus]TVY06837.1 hypothetical protein FPZ49_26930 [Paenibacillus cremeus]
MSGKFPTVIRNLNEGLDELITAMDKMNTIYQSAGQLSPMLKQFSRLVAEAAAKTSEPTVRVSQVNPAKTRIGQRKRKRRASISGRSRVSRPRIW